MVMNASAVGKGLVLAWSVTLRVPCIPAADDSNVTENDALPLVKIMFWLAVLVVAPVITTLAMPL